MAKVKVADYVCVQDTELTLDPSRALDFDIPAEAVVDYFMNSPILMFLVRSDEATGERLSLHVELNGRTQFQREIVADPAARSYHEIINREDFDPGDENTLRFTANANNNAKIIISDVVVWFQQRAES